MAYVRRMSAKRTGVNPPYVRHISAINVMKSRHHNGVCSAFANLTGVYPPHICRISSIYPSHIRHICHESETSKWRMSAVCPPFVRRSNRRMSAAFPPYVRCISAECRPLAVYSPYIRRISAPCPPYVRISTAYPPLLIAHYPRNS